MKLVPRNPIARAVLLSGALLALGAAGYQGWRFRHAKPAILMQDLRAGLAVRHAPHQAVAFLEARYGPLTEASNRQAAFIGFFDPTRIQGMALIQSYVPKDRRDSNTAAMAQWIAQYRETMPPAERKELSERLAEPAANASIHAATSLYLQQDIRYRAATAPVIRELMTTLAELQK